MTPVEVIAVVAAIAFLAWGLNSFTSPWNEDGTISDFHRGGILSCWFALGLVAFTACYHHKGFNWNYAGNGLIEFVGSYWLMRSVFKLYADKMVRGYHWGATAYFMTWGYWNMLYYPSVGDWWSFTGGLFIVSVNTFWLWQMWYYRKN